MTGRKVCAREPGEGRILIGGILGRASCHACNPCKYAGRPKVVVTRLHVWTLVLDDADFTSLYVVMIPNLEDDRLEEIGSHQRERFG
nr:hypothetical protein CFP56_10366 [Quercus suber]